MKKLIFLIAIMCLFTHGFSQSNSQLKDGLYLVAEIVKDPSKIDYSDKQKTLVRFNKLVLDNAPENSKGVIVYTTNFVPLELETEPELVPQPDNKKKLQLTFSRLASQQLANFTSNNVMKQATLIVNGEALTMNKIRETITGGKMEITSSDNACEAIYAQLKNHVKK